jgi:hypothetical protein
MVGLMAKRFDAQFNRGFGPFSHERRMVLTLHALGEDFKEDFRRHFLKALEHLGAAWSADDVVRYAGWCLEWDFGDLRAPRLVAELGNEMLSGVRRKITEREARHLCGWNRGRA